MFCSLRPTYWGQAYPGRLDSLRELDINCSSGTMYANREIRGR